MKVLMVTPYVPYPPSSGGQIRTYNLLKHLSKYNEITLVALYKNEKEKAYYPHLKSLCKEIYLCKRPEKPWEFNTITRTIFSLKPFLVVRNFSVEAKDIIRELLNKENFDVIHAETFYVMPHIPRTKTPIVLVEQTIEYQVYKHFVRSLPWYFRAMMYFDVDITKLKFWEKYYWKKANIVVAVSTPDEKIIKTEEPRIKTSIIPNGAGDEMIVPTLTKKNLKNPVVFFQGNFYWLQNSEAAQYIINKIFPIIKANGNKKIKVVIAGQNANKCQTADSKVEIVNIKTDDIAKVKELFGKATVFIAPIFGPGGTRLKILAAMGSGVPVISTPTGVEGLDVVGGQDVFIASSPDEFVKRIMELINSPTKFEQMRKNALKLVKEKYQWDKIAEKLESVYRNL